MDDELSLQILLTKELGLVNYDLQWDRVFVQENSELWQDKHYCKYSKQKSCSYTWFLISLNVCHMFGALSTFKD